MLENFHKKIILSVAFISVSLMDFIDLLKSFLVFVDKNDNNFFGEKLCERGESDTQLYVHILYIEIFSYLL